MRSLCEPVQADQGSGQVRQSLEQVGPLVVAHAEAAAEQPEEHSLDHSAALSRALAGVTQFPRGPTIGEILSNSESGTRFQRPPT